MKYISLFAGIGCADVAWAPLGWEPVAFSEIDPFASAVLAHRFPGVPNVGDVTAHDWSLYRGDVDLVVGGSPCQAFSVAGQRKSLDDKRGNLTLAFVEACNDIDPGIVVWENVPGVLSTRDNAFGCFLAGMVGAYEPLRSGPQGHRWPDAGMVVGSKRAAAYGVLDAQHFGVPQRRKRVFLVAVSFSRFGGAAGRTPNPAAILFNLPGVRGDSPALEKAGEGAVGASGIRSPGGSGIVSGIDGGLPAVSGTLGGGSGARGYANSLDVCGALIPITNEAIPESGNGPGPAPTVSAKWSKGSGGPAGDEAQNLVVIPILEVGKRTGKSTSDPRAGCGVGECGDPMYALQASARHGVATGTVTARMGSSGADENDAQRGMLVVFHPLQDPIEGREVSHAVGCGSSRGQASVAVASLTTRPYADNEAQESLLVATVAGDIAHTLRADGADASEDGTGRGTPVVAVAFQEAQTGVREYPTAGTLRANGPGHDPVGTRIRQGLSVRRLTPRECERLQGLPDDWTLIPYGRPRKVSPEMAAYYGVPEEVARTLAADGPRYKAIGNGMAVPVLWWIGQRIEWVLAKLECDLHGMAFAV